MATRRQLIGWTLAGTGALAVRHVLSRDDTLMPLSAEEPWGAVRAGFDFSDAPEPRIPMNAANLAPPWRTVRLRVAEAAAQLDRDPSFHHRELFLGVERRRAKALLAASLGVASADDLALVRNTSEANSIIVQGIDLDATDEVVIWDENHHSNNRSWGYRRQRRPFALRVVRLPEAVRGTDQVVEAFLAQLSPRTRVVTFSEISNISGLRLPVAELCAAIRAQRRDVFIHVDGAQSWGATALDLQRMGCDSFAASAHKWLCGPRELGILYVRRESAARLWPGTLGYDLHFEYPEDALPDSALRFESLGQRHDAAVAGLVTALEHQQAVGAVRIERRIGELATRLRSALESAGVRVPGSEAPHLQHGVVVADVGEGRRAFAVFRALYEQHRISAAFVHRNRVLGSPEQVDPRADRLRLRLCPHIYNTTDDLEQAAAAIREVVA
ncbi:aminotransferase class V-fold PLP-dependent enzyme [Fontimonas sp. SYSU GA230001]|uniref:aminotransferase class V-fold PLP-dependent enzyme n=1 Tax=Fontimonas sp. SYSU GA230001 TaxID=3142450 RepID=UPI0032B4E250